MSVSDPDGAKPKRTPRKQTVSERWRRMSLPNKLMILATLVIAVATVVNVATFVANSISSSHQTDKLVAYGKTQANSASDIGDAAQQFSDTSEDINGRLSDAVDQLKASADNAQNSLTASNTQSKAALDATVSASHLDQRAWVGVTAISDISAPKVGQPEDVIPRIKEQGFIDVPYSFIVKNTGKIPARYLRVASHTSFGVEPEDSRDESRGDLYPGVLFPDLSSERYPVEPIKLHMKEWMEWVFGQKFVYVYVYVEYRDAFPGTTVHHTWMCSKFENFGKQTFCHIGNDAD